MKLRELTMNEFTAFVNASPLGTYYQTSNYALLMSEYGYEYEFIGYVDENDSIKAASLILFKNIRYHVKYGYAPKGFIMDYFNQTLLEEFTKALIKYYKKKHVCFIKLNPEIAISEIDPKNGMKTYNWNYDILKYLDDNHYLRLKENLYFESILPRFQAIVSLKDFNINKVSKNTRNKINKGISRGLHIERSERSGIDILNKFIERKRHTGDYYYKDYYNVFHSNEMIDCFLVSLDSKEYLINAKMKYEDEVELNNELNNELKEHSNQLIINKKMNSDRKLIAYKSDVELSTQINKNEGKIYLAGALVIKYQNRVHIIISGYDTNYKHFDANYYLHYAILDYYKDKYDYADLNGITGDFTETNPYYGLNEFKLGFKPRIYEYIGEYDLPINNLLYRKLRNNGTLAKLFNKDDIKEKKNS